LDEEKEYTEKNIFDINETINKEIEKKIK